MSDEKKPVVATTIPILDITIRDWFATFAPEPDVNDVKGEMLMDRAANPHNDPHKPKQRSVSEIKAQLRYRHADAMMAERNITRK